MKPGDTILIPNFGEYKAFKSRPAIDTGKGTCVREDNMYCEGAKNAELCEELPCMTYQLVFFKVKQ